MNDLAALQQVYGQSIWIDFISRDALVSGELAKWIERGVLGLTSNPAIFAKAILTGKTYDDDIARLLAEGRTAEQIYETLAVADIRAAADLLRPVYERTDGLDGYVSLEVSPHLAHDTAGTISDARRLFAAVDRPNLMIKVPGTPEGIPAIATLIGSGINVNVTLLFAISAYAAAADAYLDGLEAFANAGGDPHRVASVASFFVSRLDAVIDGALAGHPDEAALHGRAGVANTRLAYVEFQRIFSGSRWGALLARGARVQRPLWASTSTKNPAYRDTMYVDDLIGPHTVNTVPPPTLTAFLEHGKLAPTLTEGVGDARTLMARLAASGIDLNEVTEGLLAAGVKAFAAAFDELMAALESKAAALTAR
jgi:transaldolase